MLKVTAWLIHLDMFLIRKILVAAISSSTCRNALIFGMQLQHAELYMVTSFQV